MLRQLLHAALLAFLILVFAPLIEPPAHATNWVLALAAKPQDGAKEAVAELLQGLYRKLGPGDRVIAYDASNLREIARIEVPSNPAIATNRNYKAKLINSAYARLWDFADAAETRQGPAGDVSPPRFLIELAALLDSLPGRTAEVIVAGSALYNDPREPTFSMAGGYVPTDGQLMLTQVHSPFGVAGRDKKLQGATVHFCYTNPPADWTTDMFRQQVGRLWAVSTTLQGGRFGSFEPLGSGCISNFLSRTASTETFVVNRSDKATMKKYERATVRERVAVSTATASPQAAPATAEALFQRPTCADAPRTMTGPMKIGIKWDCPSCDLDLYARSRPQSEWLYFHHRLPADGNGFFDYDFTAPPPGGDGFEYVQFTSVDIRDVAARVNFYNGNAPGGPSFRLRVWFAGCAYDASSLRIAAASGNGGRQDASHWTDIDVLGVVGLRGTTPAAAGR